jgi:lipopolysaccharide export system protein LptC
MTSAPIHSPREHHADWLGPREAGIEGKSIGRYSRLVSGLKLALPLIGASILLVLLLVPVAFTPQPEGRKSGAMDATMKNPVYTGQEKDGTPFTVKADEARQQPEMPNVTDLKDPKAQIDLGNGKAINMQSGTAQYNEKDGTLKLNGDLSLQHSDGTTFTTQGATVDVNNKNASGNQPARLEGNFGEVHGQGFEVRDGGKVIVFTGESSAKIKLGAPPPAMPAPAQPAPAVKP